MIRLQIGERGISDIVALILIVGLIAMVLSVYIMEEVPEEQGTAEYNTMQKVKQSFLNLRRTIQNLGSGDTAVIGLKTGTPAVSPMNPYGGPSASTNARLWAVGGWSVVYTGPQEYYDTYSSDERYLDTYVDNDNPTQNYQSGADNDHIYVSTTEGHEKWSYLKFDFTNTELYDDWGEEFEVDATIERARLLLFINNLDLPDPDTPVEVQPPINIGVWWLDNNEWEEDITWNTRPTQFANQEIENTSLTTGENAWVAWNLTNIIQKAWENTRDRKSWTQTMWKDPEDYGDPGDFGLGNPGQFSDDYKGYDNSNGLQTDPDSRTLYTLSAAVANAELYSSVFDSRSDNTYWNYLGYDYNGSPQVEVRASNNSDMSGGSGWVAENDGGNPDIHGRYAQYRVTLDPGENLHQITLASSSFSLCLRRPADGGTSTINNLATFPSEDNNSARLTGMSGGDYAAGKPPRLQITYSRTGRLPNSVYDPDFMSGTINGVPGRHQTTLSFGWLEYAPYNLESSTYQQHYVYEGGSVFAIQRGWYDVQISEPKDLVTITDAEDPNVYVTVTHYQIEPKSVQGEGAAGTGYTAVKLSKSGTEYIAGPALVPNRSGVKLIWATGGLSNWRDYIERLAAKVNYKLGGEWDQYGDYVSYDYDTPSLLIRGKVGDPNVDDIYYTEKIVWLDASYGYWQSGRT